jgi:hypothetical protein
VVLVVVLVVEVVALPPDPPSPVGFPSKSNPPRMLVHALELAIPAISKSPVRIVVFFIEASFCSPLREPDHGVTAHVTFAVGSARAPRIDMRRCSHRRKARGKGAAPRDA